MKWDAEFPSATSFSASHSPALFVSAEARS